MSGIWKQHRASRLVSHMKAYTAERLGCPWRALARARKQEGEATPPRSTSGWCAVVGCCDSALRLRPPEIVFEPNYVVLPEVVT